MTCYYLIAPRRVDRGRSHRQRCGNSRAWSVCSATPEGDDLQHSYEPVASRLSRSQQNSRHSASDVASALGLSPHPRRRAPMTPGGANAASRVDSPPVILKCDAAGHPDGSRDAAVQAMLKIAGAGRGRLLQRARHHRADTAQPRAGARPGPDGRPSANPRQAGTSSGTAWPTQTSARSPTRSSRRGTRRRPPQ